VLTGVIVLGVLLVWFLRRRRARHTGTSEVDRPAR
jgi:hypothetical protein